MKNHILRAAVAAIFAPTAIRMQFLVNFLSVFKSRRRKAK